MLKVFQVCDNLKHVDIVEGELHETIAALQLGDWRNDMNEEINSINQILPNADAGYYIDNYSREDLHDGNPGEKARAIRRWIRSVLGKIIRYQQEHQHIMDEATTTLQLALSQDIVMNNILSYLTLPPHTFEVGDHDEDEFSE